MCFCRIFWLFKFFWLSVILIFFWLFLLFYEKHFLQLEVNCVTQIFSFNERKLCQNVRKHWKLSLFDIFKGRGGSELCTEVPRPSMIMAWWQVMLKLIILCPLLTCDKILLAPLYLNSSQNTQVNWIVRLLLSVLSWPKVILSGGHSTFITVSILVFRV